MSGSGTRAPRRHRQAPRHATTVLHGIDLAIEPGEFFVLLGPSGSGKTTTLRILAGLESVNAGRVLMDGADVTTQEPGARDVAMVFQSYALYPHMTVEQNIGFPLKMVGVARGEIGRAVAGAAAKVGIGHLLQRTPGQLSGGQQQRCRAGPRDRAPAAPVPARRAALQPRRQAAPRDAPRAHASCSARSASRRSTSRTTRKRR